jgi:hypothetical protein
MLQDANLFDAWTQIINLLSSPAASLRVMEESIDHVPIRRVFAESNGAKCEPSVRVVDRPTALTLMIDWRDATKCCYREQRWVAAHARVAGRCALSSAPISPGDEIFRPRRAGSTPRNVGAMILASAVETYAPSAPHPAASTFSCTLGPRDWGAIVGNQIQFAK